MANSALRGNHPVCNSKPEGRHARRRAVSAASRPALNFSSARASDALLVVLASARRRLLDVGDCVQDAHQRSVEYIWVGWGRWVRIRWPRCEGALYELHTPAWLRTPACFAECSRAKMKDRTSTTGGETLQPSTSHTQSLSPLGRLPFSVVFSTSITSLSLLSN